MSSEDCGDVSRLLTFIVGSAFDVYLVLWLAFAVEEIPFLVFSSYSEVKGWIGWPEPEPEPEGLLAAEVSDKFLGSGMLMLDWFESWKEDTADTPCTD